MQNQRYGENSSIREVKESEEVRQAAIEFITDLKTMISDPEDLVDIDSALVRVINEEPAICGEITASLFNTFLSDNIRVHEGTLPAVYDESTVYYRSDAYRSSLSRALAKSIGLNLDPDDYVLASDVSYLKYYYPNQYIYELPLNTALSILKKSEIVSPVCGLDTHDLVKLLILLGVNPIRVMSGFITPPQHLSIIKNFSKARSNSELSLDYESSSILEQEISSHWLRILQEDGLYSNVMLCNSGSMANECALIALSELKKCHKEDTWYYENETTAGKLFVSAKRWVEADLLLTNVEPTNSFNLGAEEPGDFTNPDLVLQRSIDSATKNPEKIIAIVIDCTTNPLFKVSANLPDNLLVVKTVSTTKHQNGDRRFFSGVCCAYAKNPGLLKHIHPRLFEARDITGSHPRIGSLLNFPSPAAEDIETKRQYLLFLNKMIAEYINKNNKGLWYLSPYSYHSFVFPPERVLSKIREIAFKGEEKLESYSKHLSQAIFSITREYVLASGSSDFEFGDSFGLPVSRVHVQGGYSFLPDGTAFRVKIPRMCFGYNTTLEKALIFSQGLVKELNKHL